ncbi:hypothetical protein HY494_00315 [Candidatus Woesearchaeota archaeon]|nr:hypothetical protein [Candidatus Woesearchaeota archaeon]
MSLETITGNLRDAYKQLQSGTMLHVDQLMNERRGNADLCNNEFYVADGLIYFLDGAGTPTLAMTREAHNPVLKNINDAFFELEFTGNYHPSHADVQQALAAPETVLIALPNLRLSKQILRMGDLEFKYLDIGTTPARYNKLNDEKRKFAERVYGQGNDFPQNMKLLKDTGISETYIWVLNPDYVRKHAEKGAVAQAYRLSNFNDHSQFSVSGYNVVDHFSVRGAHVVGSSPTKATRKK